MTTRFPHPLPEGSVSTALLGHVQELHKDVHGWITDEAGGWTGFASVNMPYTDLMFALGFGILGDSNIAKGLLEQARTSMIAPVQSATAPAKSPKDENYNPIRGKITRGFLFSAFEYRISQVLSGRLHQGSLSHDLIEQLAKIDSADSTPRPDLDYLMASYVISRAREQFRSIEPDDLINPYEKWTKRLDDLNGKLAELADCEEPTEIRSRFHRLYDSHTPVRSAGTTRLQILHRVLPLSLRVSEAFASELLDLVPVVLQQLGETNDPRAPRGYKWAGELLDNAFLLAAQLGLADQARQLADSFLDLIRREPTSAFRFSQFNGAAVQCFYSLRAISPPEERVQFLTRVGPAVFQGAGLSELKNKYEPHQDEWAAALCSLLNLAVGWVMFGQRDRAFPVLDEACLTLKNPSQRRLSPAAYVDLARTYISLLGELPADMGLPAMANLFRNMPTKRVSNTWATASYFSRFHLGLVEETVATVCRMASGVAVP